MGAGLTQRLCTDHNINQRTGNTQMTPAIAQYTASMAQFMRPIRSGMAITATM